MGSQNGLAGAKWGLTIENLRINVHANGPTIKSISPLFQSPFPPATIFE